MKTHHAIVVAGLLLGAATAAHGQTRDQLVRDFTRDKQNVIAYAGAMPDSALGFRPTPGVRTFAEQIEHVVQSNADVAAAALRGAPTPALGDRKVYLGNKAALVKYVTDAYDYTIAAVREATPAALQKSVSVYKLPPQAAVEWLVLAREHSSWTLGQVVPYLRLNGAKPPEYQLPF